MSDYFLRNFDASALGNAALINFFLSPLARRSGFVIDTFRTSRLSAAIASVMTPRSE
jgi:hypothetical protein